jgi:hypothetical protein
MMSRNVKLLLYMCVCVCACACVCVRVCVCARAFQELYGKQDLVACINKGRLRWLGHVERMEDNRVPKRMLYSRPGGRKGDPG